MKKRFNLTGIVAVSIFFISIMFSCTVTSGPKIKQVREISSFSAVKVSSGLEVILTQADSTHVVVETNEDFLPYITTEKEDETLVITASPKFKFFGMGFKHATIYITTPHMTGLSVGSGCDVNITDTLKVQTLNMDIASGSALNGKIICTDKYDLSLSSGSSLEIAGKFTTMNIDVASGSNLELKGMANDLNIKVSSGSEIEGFDFTVKNLVCKVSSGSSLEMTVDETLDVTASSGSSIKYKGRGKVLNSDISMGASFSNKN